MTRTPRSLTRLGAILVVLGCGDGDGGDDRGPGGPGAACASQSACAPELVCYLGVCHAEEPPSATCPVASLGAMPRIVSGGMVSVEDPGDACVLPQGVADPGDGHPSQVIALGEHPVGTTLTFSLPAGSIGFSIVSQEKADPPPGTAVETIQLRSGSATFSIPNSVVPTRLRDPAGAVLWDDMEFPEDPETALVYYGGITQTTGTLTIPNTPLLLDRVYTAGSLPAGIWQFTVNDFAWECTDPRLASVCGASGSASGVYDITVITKNGPLASTGSVNIAVYLVTDSLTADAAPANAGFQRFVRSLALLLANGGLCVDTVIVYDVPAWARDRFRDVGIDDDPNTEVDEGGPCGPLAQMFTLSRGANALQLFLVDSFVSVQEDTQLAIAGIDGSIPGPSTVNGTVNSGAAVAIGSTLGVGSCTSGINLRSCGSDFLAYVAAHELGHWLGLYHVTEATGGTFDPLTDTPTCRCNECVPVGDRAACGTSGGLVFAEDCDGVGEPATCGGSDNLMFWLVDQMRSVGNLTRQQGQIIRINPAVR